MLVLDTSVACWIRLCFMTAVLFGCQQRVHMAIRSTALPSLFLCMCFLVPSRAHRTGCRIELKKADCSHMSLNTIPQDLPEDIRVLDVSHNRLVDLKPSSLTRYHDLEQLDTSYNSLKVVPRGLCEAVPELWWLSLRHNEVHLVQEQDLRNCARLTHLDLSDNRLRLIGEPFSGTEVGRVSVPVKEVWLPYELS